MDAVHSVWERHHVKPPYIFAVEEDASFFIGDDLDVREALVGQEVTEVLPRDVDVVLVDEVLQHGTHRDRAPGRNLIRDEVFDVVENGTQGTWPAGHRVHVVGVRFVALDVPRNGTLGDLHDRPDVVLRDGRSSRPVVDGGHLLLPLHRPERRFHACQSRQHR